MRKVLLLLIFISCNPVKQVLKNQDKFNEVAEEVIRRGYCANDTIYTTKSDTIIKVDTLVTTDTVTDVLIYNDSVFITKWKTKNIVKSVTIRDTLKSYIVDNARVKSLQTDSTTLTIKMNEWKHKANIRLSWLISLFIIALVYVYLKLKKK